MSAADEGRRAKSKRLTLVVLVVALIMGVVLAVGKPKKGEGGGVLDQRVPAPPVNLVHTRDAKINRVLREVAENLNKSVPAVKGDMRLDRVSTAHDRRIIYELTILDPIASSFAQADLEEMRPSLHKDLCAHPDLEVFRTYGVTYVNKYSDISGRTIGSIEVNMLGCRWQRN